MKKVRSSLVLFAIFCLLLVAGCGNNQQSDTINQAVKTAELTNIKLGYQKGMSLLSILKEKGELDTRLKEKGFSVTWHEFPSTPAMLEAMGNNGIVFGGGGATGSIFAQSAERAFVRVGAQTGVDGGSSVIVLGDSDIKTVADLKGKKVAVAKGTTQHYMLARALEKEGLKFSDINLLYINPAEAFAAFGRRDFDAWAIWDPFTAEAERKFQARVIADNTSVFGENAPIEGENLYYASQDFVNKHPEIINIILEELGKLGSWVNNNVEESAKILANLYGSDLEIMKAVEKRAGSRKILPMNEETIKPLQNIADFFYESEIIPKKIDASDKKYNWVSK